MITLENGTQMHWTVIVGLIREPLCADCAKKESPNA